MNRGPSVAVVQLSLAASGLLVNFSWGMIQSPLYEDVERKPYEEILTSRLHCTLGDVAILLGAYWIVALVTGDRFWALHGRVRDVATFTALGLAYTVVSEWITSLSAAGGGYAAAMPRGAWIGTGLAPLVQWLILPPLIAMVSRRLATQAV